MGPDDRTLNWLVNQAHELARGLDLYATALEEADDQARRDLLRGLTGEVIKKQGEK